MVICTENIKMENYVCVFYFRVLLSKKISKLH